MIGVPVAPPLEQVIPACELLPGAVIGAVAGFQIAVIIEPLSGVLFVCRVQLVRQSDKFKASIVVCAYNARVGDRAVVVFPDFPLRVGDKDFTVGLFLRCSGGGVLVELLLQRDLDSNFLALLDFGHSGQLIKQLVVCCGDLLLLKLTVDLPECSISVVFGFDFGNHFGQLLKHFHFPF